MDILLDKSGDLHITQDGDISLEDPTLQKILIRLRWLEREWRWDRDEGLPYMDSLLVKDPDTDYFESVVREKIFEVDEVVEVREVSVTFDRRTRQASIWFVAVTDLEVIRKEAELRCLTME